MSGQWTDRSGGVSVLEDGGVKIKLVGGPEDGREVEMQPWNNAHMVTVERPAPHGAAVGIPDPMRYVRSSYVPVGVNSNTYAYAGEIESPNKPLALRDRRFAWLPTEVYSAKNYRCGFKWLTWVYLDEDGRYYITAN